MAFWYRIVTLSYFFFDQKVQHCGQACLPWCHMVLGVMVPCSNFLAFFFMLTIHVMFLFFWLPCPHVFNCVRSSGAKLPGWLDTATFASRHRPFENGSSSGKVKMT